MTGPGEAADKVVGATADAVAHGISWYSDSPIFLTGVLLGIVVTIVVGVWLMRNSALIWRRDDLQKVVEVEITQPLKDLAAAIQKLTEVQERQDSQNRDLINRIAEGKVSKT